jgi:hypothetical protein
LKPASLYPFITSGEGTKRVSLWLFDTVTVRFRKESLAVDPPYYQAARYPNKSAAGKAYTPIERIIHDEECDLSAYRYLVPSEKKWYVVVIGEEPSPQLHERLKTILTSLTRGEPITLDSATITVLLARRVQQMQHGPWVERHYPVDQE